MNTSPPRAPEPLRIRTRPRPLLALLPVDDEDDFDADELALRQIIARGGMLGAGASGLDGVDD